MGTRRHALIPDIVLGISLALLAVGCQSHTMTSAPPYPAQPSQEPLVERALDNGLVVVVQEDHKSPLVSLVALVNTGSVSEGPYAGTGVSHFLEHMLFKGTERRPVGAVEQEIKALGGDFNAFTSFDYTGYTIIVPSEHLKPALDILADVLFHPSFDPAEVEKEREVIVSEMRMNRDDPERALSDLFWQTAFVVHPYRHPVIGYEELLRKVTREDLVAYHHARYATNNMVLTIVGAVEAESAMEVAEALFGPAPRQRLAPEAIPAEGAQISVRRRMLERVDVKVGRLMIGFHTVPVAHEDLFSLDVLAIILGEGESARFTQRLVKEHRLVYDIDAYSYTPKFPGVFGVTCELDPSKFGEAREVIFGVIEEVKRGRITHAELEKAKTQVLASYYAERQQVRARGVNLAVDRLLTGDTRFSERYVEGVRGVQREDLARVAAQYLQREAATIVELQPAGSASVEPQATRVGRAEVERLELPNGLRVLIREDHALPLVHLACYFNGGVRVESQDTNGLAHLTAQLLIKGTSHRTALQIAEEVESLGGGLVAYGGNNSFGVGLSTLAPRLERSLEILKELVTQSSFPEEELAIEREVTLSAIRERAEDIFHVSSRALREALFEPHPYAMHYLGREDSVGRLTRDQLIRFYRQWGIPNNAVISVFGDVDRARVEALVARLFGNWTGSQPPSLTLPSPPPLEKRVERIQSFPKEQAVVMYGFPGVSMADPDRYVLDVVTGILSGSGGRLYGKIREEHGLAYSVGAFSLLGPDPGMYVVYAATSPQTADHVKALLAEQVRQLPTTITQEDVELAKRLLLGQRRMQLETNPALALEASLDELFGLGHRQYLEYEESVKRVTLEDVVRVVKARFDIERCVLVVTGPHGGS